MTNVLLEKIQRLVSCANRRVEQEGTANLSLFDGLGSLALLNYYLSLASGKEVYKKEAGILVDRIIDAVMADDLTDYFTFARGLSGIGSLLYFLSTKLGVEFESAPEVDGLLEKLALREIKSHNVDFLYGSMGCVCYFLNSAKRLHVNRHRIERVLSEYMKCCVVDKRGVRFVNSMLIDREEFEYDLGLAHGLSGHLVILSRVYAKSIRPLVTKKYIDDGLKYIESVRRDERASVEAIYSTSVIEKGENIENKNKEMYFPRLGWCYGDLSIACMYMSLAKHLGEKRYFDKGMEIALETLKRDCPESARISDIYYCHGSSNLAFMYHRFYLATGNDLFQKRSLYWLDYTLAHFNISSYEDKPLDMTLSLLSGAFGCLLPVLNIKYGVGDEDWREFLLIDF